MGENLEMGSRSKRAMIMSSLYDLTSNVAEEKGMSSHRGLAAHAAANLLSMGLNNLEAKELTKNEIHDLTNENYDLIEKMPLSAEEFRNQKANEESHFMDRFMERLAEKVIPTDSPDAKLFHERIKDPSRNLKKPLSVVLLVSNLKRMSSKMGGFFRLQYGVIHIFTWRNQPKTLFTLVVYTSVCLWPHLVVCLPVLFLLFGVILPHYLQRHPMVVTEILPVKKRSRSFFQFFSESQNNSLLFDYLNEDSSPIESNLLTTESTVSSGDYTISASSEAVEEPILPEQDDSRGKKSGKSDKSKVIKSQVSLLMNMRDLQNLTSDLLDGLDHAETLATDFLSFKNERLSTVVFYVVLLLTLVVFFLGQFIPWRLLFIIAGWTVMGMLHPGAKDLIASLKTNQKQAEEPTIVKPIPSRAILPESYVFDNIIVDNEPEIRTVEIYELQAKDFFKHEWSLFAYTKRVYDWKDPVRVAGKIPHGVNNLRKVLPPKEWKYDFGYANNWFIDTNPAKFMEERKLDKSHLRTRNDTSEGWIYDVVPVDQENIREFRRRRLYRTCYQYARPVKPIKIA